MSRAKMAADAVGLRLYEDHGSGSPARHAETQLAGRSHYYSGGTRRFFGARVSIVSTALDGLLLVSVESLVPPDSEGRRRFRGVVFDLLGDVVHRTGFFASSGAAWRRVCQFIAKEYHGIDAEADRIVSVHAERLHRSLASCDKYGGTQ